MHSIVIKGVSKDFKDGKRIVHALRDISLEIESGELFGILGPNGAGKSTLINMMIGMLLPDKGSITILGNDITKSPETLEEMNYISGETRFHWSLTSREILKMAAILYNIPSKKADMKIEELLTELGIKDYAERRFDSLSTGQRVRLALAKAMLNNPKVLLLDEPTLGLDPHIAVKVRELIKKINQENKTTIILTSHYMPEIEQLCKRIAFIHEGKIIDVGDIEKVKLKQFIRYTLKVHVDRLPGSKVISRLGLAADKNLLITTVEEDESLNEILSELVKAGCVIKNVELKKPSLEDYFIKIVGGKR